MAIEIEFEDQAGVVHGKAYARVNKTIIENPAKGKKNVTVEVCIHASREALDAGKNPVWGPQSYPVEVPAVEQPMAKEGESPPALVMECAVDPDSVDPADLYAWLKTQDQYQGGKDV